MMLRADDSVVYKTEFSQNLESRRRRLYSIRLTIAQITPGFCEIDNCTNNSWDLETCGIYFVPILKI